MEKVLFTQLKTVAEYAKDYRAKHQNCLDFHTIVNYLYKQNMLINNPIIFRRSTKTLSDSEFCEHALDQVIDATRIISSSTKHDVYESFGLFYEKDIYTMVTLPFIRSEHHVHDYYEILYVYRGNCTYFFQDTSFPLHKGQLLLLSPNTPHHIMMDEDGLGLTINIRKSTFQNTFQSLLNEHNLLSDFFAHTFYDAETSNYITFDIENTPEFNYLIQQIFDESNCTENHSNMICVSLLNLFFGKLLQDFGRTIHLYSDVNNATYNRSFPLMLKYVQSNYQTITLPMMSQIFHYNESYISLLFKKYLNENFSNVVQNLRLEQSKNLLENTDYNLEKISEMIGYNSVDHFSRIFKRKYGMAPSKYRKECKTAGR
ncbi:AraC family transcriptional regulator [Ruminococcus sp.]|uniref:AraC family transcriptional regulator n=1 Tax=Ruminococcus sp. TaxID=41978 RepID=UPI003526E7DF